MVGKKRKTLEEFIADARKVHGDKYDYSLIKEYVNNKTSVLIRCLKCGLVFPQTPSSHINNKSGCPNCSQQHVHEVQKGVTRKSVRKLLFGVARFDVTETCNGEFGKIYRAWKSMLTRCYDEKYLLQHPTYQKCSVCTDWLLFSNFLKWALDKDNGFAEGYHLDKDIRVKGCKVYSPQTCCFVPREINDMLVKPSNKSGGLPICITKRNNLYYASHGIALLGKTKAKSLGYFRDIESAFAAYKESKEAYIKEVAQKYFDDGKITKRVYDALMKYEVEITD